MSNKLIKTDPQPQQWASSHKQTSKRSLLVRFIVFIAWVVIIGLLIALVACQQYEPIIFVIGMDN